jgi:hypothetical protein
MWNFNRLHYDEDTWTWNQDLYVDGVSSVFNNRSNITEYASDNGPTAAWDCQIPGGGHSNLSTWTYPHGPNAGANENDNVGYFDLFSSGSCP